MSMLDVLKKIYTIFWGVPDSWLYAVIALVILTKDKIVMFVQKGEERWEMESFDLGDSWSIIQSLQ